MGLLGSMLGWAPMVNYYAGTKGDEYTCLVLDNRGSGYSKCGSLALYSIKSMAEDALAVIDEVKWTEERSIHLAGISMGGMISQRIALLAPNRLKSLTLLATCAKHIQPENQGSTAAAFLKLHSDNETKVNDQIKKLFADEEWLNAHDPRYPEFATNRDKYFTNNLQLKNNDPNPTPYKTVIGQGYAAMRHSVSNEELKKIGEQVPYTVAMAGTADALIHPDCTIHLAKYIGCKCVILPGRGHGMTGESEKEVLHEMQLVIDASESFYGQ